MSKNTLPQSATLMEAIGAIEATTKRLAVVISKDREVMGTLTDGDIRRHILLGNTLQAAKVVDAMNTQPVTAPANMSDSLLKELLKKHNIRAIPLVDNSGKYVRTLHEWELIHTDQEMMTEPTFSAAVIMAGGEGQRLRPLTENLPKPMLDINGFPLLERQIRRLHKMGITVIYISVNYLGEVIQEYFGDGSKFGVNVRYLNENKKLGTAGALSMLPALDNEKPILVMNGDILTTSDFVHLFHFHQDHQSDITISAIDYHVEIPYGVIQCDGANVRALQEKPSQRFLCNAGIYALSARAIKKIPKNTFWNMTDLIENCLQDGDAVSVFPVHEYWTDIGTPADLKKAREEFKGT